MNDQGRGRLVRLAGWPVMLALVFFQLLADAHRPASVLNQRMDTQKITVAIMANAPSTESRNERNAGVL